MKTRGHRLDRRRFLKTTGAGLAGIALLPRSPVDAFAETSAVSPRRVFDFNHKWLFSDKRATGATTLGFSDSGFERVTIPHTNRMLPWHGFDDKDYQDMIRRDWNHPSIVLWGVRINESRDDHDFYTRTNQVARRLDDSRQTGGVRNRYDSELLEDVFTMNDFQIPLRAPNHPMYLNTEFIGHMYPTKRNDNIERITEHTMRHARVHNQLSSDKRYAAAWAGAPSITTPTHIFVPATGCVITA